MTIENVIGMPGLRDARVADQRRILRQGDYTYLAGGGVIDGALARDSGNTGYLTTLRAGTLLGKITSGGKYAPAILGVSTGAEIATATTVTVSAAQATEIVRRVGATGTLLFIGPPSAAGTVAAFTETYSAVDTATGIITCSALDAALIAGSFVCANDGSAYPMTFVPESTTHGWGIEVQDRDGNDLDVPLDRLPIAGVIDSSQLLLWPTDTSLQSWITGQLNGETTDTGLGKGRGKFVQDYVY